MKVRDVRQGWALALVMIAACAMNPRPGDPGYPYNLDGRYEATFLVNGETYLGTPDLSTSADGGVGGSYVVAEPMAVRGRVDGEIIANAFESAGRFVMGNDCEGELAGDGTVDAGGAAATGEMTILLEDPCGGPMVESYRFER